MKTCFLNFARDQSAAVLNQKMLNRTWHSETFTRNEMARVVRHSQRLSKKLELRIWSKVGHKAISWLWLPDWLRLLRTIPSEKVCLNMTIWRWMSPRIGLYGSCQQIGHLSENGDVLFLHRSSNQKDQVIWKLQFQLLNMNKRGGRRGLGQ